MDSSTSTVYFQINRRKGVLTNIRVPTGGNGADLVVTFEGWDPSANSGLVVSHPGSEHLLNFIVI